MKTAILYHHRTQAKGAEGSHIRGMVDGFRQLGCAVDIIGPPGVDPYAKTESSQPALPQSNYKKWLSLFAERAPQLLFELAELLYNIPAYFRLRKKISESHSYNFIYERYSLNCLAGAKIAAVKKLPFVLEVNDATIIERSRPLFFKWLARKNERYVFARADLMITITNHFKQLMIDAYHIEADKIVVLPNAIDAEKFIIEPHQRLNRVALQIPEAAIVLGCVGAFVPWHGLGFLVDTVGSYAVERNIYLLFIGDGPVKNDILEKAKKHNMSERIHFTGFVEAGDVVRYLDLVDICVIPGSNPHCSPMKLFEYMAMGKPVVLPRYKPLLETVTDEKDALFFDPDDKQGLNAALMKLIDSVDLRQKLGVNGRSKVNETYTWQINCSKVLSLMDFLKK